MNTLKVIVPSFYNQISLMAFLEDMKIAKSKISSLETNKEVTVNGFNVPFSKILSLGDELVFQLSEKDSLDYEPSNTEAKIVYEDDFVFVVEKPSGMIMYSDDFKDQQTLANSVARTLLNRNESMKIRHLHRIDRDTSGLVMYAKHFLAHAFYSANWESNLVKRDYLAIIEGTLPKKSGVIDLPIGKDRHRNNHFLVLPTGKKAVTRYKVLKEFSDSSLVQFTLDSGRTHQIRVHLSYLKHPIVGDTAYGSVMNGERVYLHSYSITFFHPLKQTFMTVLSELPVDMTRFIQKRGFYEH